MCDDCAASVLCEADIEDRYLIIYKQCESKTVLLKGCNILSTSIDVSGCFREFINEYSLSMIITKEREELFSKKEVKQARIAGEFIKKWKY